MAANNNHCDNWERLVRAVVKKEELRQIALNPSPSPTISSSRSPASSSSFTLCLSATKIVIKPLNEQKRRQFKALNGLKYALKQMVPREIWNKTRVSNANTKNKIAKRSQGVESSVALQDGKKNQLVVTGEGIDFIGLLSLLRRNVGYVELISVTQWDDENIELNKSYINLLIQVKKCIAV